MKKSYLLGKKYGELSPDSMKDKKNKIKAVIIFYIVIVWTVYYLLLV